MNINSKHTYILGISCFYHDSAAALIKDGELIAAAHEERFTRKKHDDSFPKNAINYCLKEAGISSADLGYIGFYDKPLLKFDRILINFISSWPRNYKYFMASMPAWLKGKMWIKDLIRQKLNYHGPVYFSEHHMSHAASSFFVSPFKEAAILTVDGVGEWATATWGKGFENKIDILEEIHYPNSLGLFYSLITYYLGFKPNDAEYKVMGLAPYGRPLFTDKLRKLITIYEDGSFKNNQGLLGDYFETKSFEKNLERILGFPKRSPESTLEQHHKDLAASLQEVTNEAMVKMAKYVFSKVGSENLCLAGGVALNCVTNSKILKEAPFKNIFIQPAAGDAGGALGVAYYIWHQVLGNSRCFQMKHCLWGPSFDNDGIKSFLDETGVKYNFYPEDQLIERAASMLERQKVIGWFQGRMEWGPRALGSRSILADARNKDNWQRVNLKIKFRESFRPFAPSVLEEDSAHYFDFPYPSPYMLFITDVKRGDIPAVTHVDRTARIQTVDPITNPLYYKLIKRFKEATGCSVIINTSFNIREEPIVCTPEDAFKTFIKTDMDSLVIGNFILEKETKYE